MCFKKWFCKPDPVQDPNPVHNVKTALLFAINNYPGSTNDLNGCLNDQVDVINKLNSLFPGFNIKRFEDEQVTRSVFIREVTAAIKNLISGDTLLVHYSGHGTQEYDIHSDEADGYDEAIYLYDGTVIDEDIAASLRGIPDGATVILMFDSCFSGSVTRASLNPVPNPFATRFRFIQNPRLPKRNKKTIRIPKEEMKWIVLSGCGEQQTSADAYFNGRANGAFTYYALKTLVPGITYTQWFEQIRRFLPSDKFNQAPTLEGKGALFSNIVFI